MTKKITVLAIIMLFVLGVAFAADNTFGAGGYLVNSKRAYWEVPSAKSMRATRAASSFLVEPSESWTVTPAAPASSTVPRRRPPSTVWMVPGCGASARSTERASAIMASSAGGYGNSVSRRPTCAVVWVAPESETVVVGSLNLSYSPQEMLP